MNRYSFKLWLGWLIPVVLLAACAGTGQQSAQNTQTLDENRLLDDLREGGYVIFFRHAAADDSPQAADLSDCATRQVLGGLGRVQSKVIGNSFKKLKIPVGEVTTSPQCHSVNMATLAFGKANPSPEISGTTSQNSQASQKGVNTLRKMLGSSPGRGGNSVIVASDYSLLKASGIKLEAGEAAIYKPLGDGSAKLVRRIMPSEWQRLAAGL